MALWSFSQSRARLLGRVSLLFLYLLMTLQFVGCYLFLERPYVNLLRYSTGQAHLPFQTRVLLAPLFGWALRSPFMAHWAHHFSVDKYYFPHGVGPCGVLELFLNVPCLLIAGWATVRLYQSASRHQLFPWLVYPLFLVLCAVTYILHAVQNYRFTYDMPSLMFFALGLYWIHARKPFLWLAALFAIATLNRETTLLLIPFFLLSACIHPLYLVPGSASSHNRITHFDARRALHPAAAVPAALLLAYWVVWHLIVFHVFRNNVSEYHPRLRFNWIYLSHVRYYPQLFSACGYVLPVLFLFRKYLRDPQLRVWLWMIPVWFALMSVWGLLVETRIFGELLPFVACATALIAEEALVAAVQRSRVPAEEDSIDLLRVA